MNTIIEKKAANGNTYRQLHFIHESEKEFDKAYFAQTAKEGGTTQSITNPAHRAEAILAAQALFTELIRANWLGLSNNEEK